MTFKRVQSAYRTSESGEPEAGVALPDNLNQDPLCDEFGRVWARQYPPAPAPPQPAPNETEWIQSVGLVSMLEATGRPYLLIANAWHQEAGPVWLQVHDSNAAPVNGAVPVFSWPMPAAPGLSSLDISAFPYRVFGRLWFAFSSSGDMLTTGPTGWVNALVGALV